MWHQASGRFLIWRLHNCGFFYPHPPLCPQNLYRVFANVLHYLTPLPFCADVMYGTPPPSHWCPRSSFDAQIFLGEGAGKNYAHVCRFVCWNIFGRHWQKLRTSHNGFEFRLTCKQINPQGLFTHLRISDVYKVNQSGHFHTVNCILLITRVPICIFWHPQSCNNGLHFFVWVIFSKYCRMDHDMCDRHTQ